MTAGASAETLGNRDKYKYLRDHPHREEEGIHVPQLGGRERGYQVRTGGGPSVTEGREGRQRHHREAARPRRGERQVCKGREGAVQPSYASEQLECNDIIWPV